MTEFKINRGLSSNLPSKLTDGWVYFCTDTGEIYTDCIDNGILRRKKIKSLDALQKSGGTMEGALKFTSETHFGTATPSMAEEGQVYFKEGLDDLRDKSALNKCGDTMNGALSFSEGVHYGEELPDEAEAGQVYFVIDIPKIPALNECAWAQISEISTSGQAANYWSVGDCKAVDIKGTVGTLALDTTLYVYIIGFDHNGATNTVDFGTFKTAAGIGNDVCLVDSAYENSSSNGIKYFNMNHSSNTNSGGWKGCDLRYDILGSTHANGADANETTTSSPVPNTLMAALPADLRAVMKPMEIWTDNTAGGLTTAAEITSSTDYLPLMAEFEVFGTRSMANTNEQYCQRQYEYFANGNSQIKGAHNSTSTSGVGWWYRSPRFSPSISDDVNFVIRFYTIASGGQRVLGNASMSFGLAPIFRV